MVSGPGALKKARELFQEMNDAQKDHYLKLAKKEKLAYEIIKREYNSKNKKPRTQSAYNLFVSELTGTAQEKYSDEGFFNYAYKMWKRLDQEKKSKFEKEARRLKEEADREHDERKSLEKSAPKKALSAYNLFVRDRMPDLKTDYPNKEQTEFFSMIADEYSKLSSTEKTKLQRRADKEKQRYEKEKSAYDVEMTQMNVSQFGKQEEKKEKEREARSKSKTTKKTTVASKSKDKSISRTKKKGVNSSGSNVESEVESEAESEAVAKSKRNKTKESKANDTKGKKAEESDVQEKENKSKRGQSKKGKNTAK